MIEISLPSGSKHLVKTFDSGAPDIEGYSTSLNTQAALQAACDAGHWEAYTPPVLPPEALPPDWKAFRLALLKSKTFRTWSELLPASWREDLKISAAVANAEALQATYDQCRLLSLPLPTIAAGWQQIADANSIPVSFR